MGDIGDLIAGLIDDRSWRLEGGERRRRQRQGRRGLAVVQADLECAIDEIPSPVRHPPRGNGGEVLFGAGQQQRVREVHTHPALPPISLRHQQGTAGAVEVDLEGKAGAPEASPRADLRAGCGGRPPHRSLSARSPAHRGPL